MKCIKKYKYDILLFIMFSLLSVFLYFVVNSKEAGSTVIIKCNGAVKHIYPIDIDQEILIESEFGVNNVKIIDKKVSVVDADCPDGLCVHSGAIANTGASIICLPNRLEIIISGVNDIDATAY